MRFQGNLIRENDNCATYVLDCKTVRIFAYSSTREQSNKRSENIRACEARALRARKTLTPRFTDFFTDFEKKTDCLAVYIRFSLPRRRSFGSSRNSLQGGAGTRDEALRTSAWGYTHFGIYLRKCTIKAHAKLTGKRKHAKRNFLSF